MAKKKDLDLMTSSAKVVVSNLLSIFSLKTFIFGSFK